MDSFEYYQGLALYVVKRDHLGSLGDAMEAFSLSFLIAALPVLRGAGSLPGPDILQVHDLSLAPGTSQERSPVVAAVDNNTYLSTQLV